MRNLKKIIATIDLKKLFTASHKINGMLDKIVSSRLMFPKSNEELSPILIELSDIRKRMGVPESKTHEPDKAAGDGNI